MVGRFTGAFPAPILREVQASARLHVGIPPPGTLGEGPAHVIPGFTYFIAPVFVNFGIGLLIFSSKYPPFFLK
jgi:hypothetical protein